MKYLLRQANKKNLLQKKHWLDQAFPPRVIKKRSRGHRDLANNVGKLRRLERNPILSKFILCAKDCQVQGHQ